MTVQMTWTAVVVPSFHGQEVREDPIVSKEIRPILYLLNSISLFVLPFHTIFSVSNQTEFIFPSFLFLVDLLTLLSSMEREKKLTLIRSHKRISLINNNEIRHMRREMKGKKEQETNRRKYRKNRTPNFWLGDGENEGEKENYYYEEEKGRKKKRRPI